MRYNPIPETEEDLADYRGSIVHLATAECPAADPASQRDCPDSAHPVEEPADPSNHDEIVLDATDVRAFHGGFAVVRSVFPQVGIAGYLPPFARDLREVILGGLLVLLCR